MVVKDIYIVDDYCFFCGMVCSLADSQFYAIYGYFDINDFFSNYMNLNIYILNSLTTTAPPSLERLVVYPYNSSYKLVAYGHEGSSYSKVVEIDDAMNPAPTCSVADMGSFFWNGARLMIQDIILTNDYVVFLTDDANMRIGYSYGNKNAVVNDLVSLPNKFYYLPDEVNGIMVGVALENDDIGMAYVHYNSYFSTRLRVIDVTTGTDLYSYEFYKYDKEDPIKMVYLNKLGKIELLQPITTLSDFVQAGIDHLYGNYGKKGFFFMVEGGEIDGAGHNNDAICNIKEINDFAKAIDVVLAFYEKHPDETLILVTADHETGGLELGDNYIMHPELLYGHTKSEGEINKLFREFAGVGPDRNPLPNRRIPPYHEMQHFLSEHLGLWSTIEVSEAQEAHFRDLYHRAFVLNETEMVEALYSVSNRIVSDAITYADRQAGYIWTHGGHTGSPVGLYVKGAGAVEFNACTDNTMISQIIKRLAKY